jgi:hypothetical protein
MKLKILNRVGQKNSYKDFTKWIKEAKELIAEAEILFEEANKL